MSPVKRCRNKQRDEKNDILLFRSGCSGVSHVPCVWWRLKGRWWRGAGVLHSEKGKAPAPVGAVGLGEAGALIRIRAAHVRGYGAHLAFWLVLNWNQGQKFGKPSVMNQVLAIWVDCLRNECLVSWLSH